MPSFTTTIPNLQKAGPIVEILITPAIELIEVLRSKNQPIPSPLKVLAMIDTGATSSVVNPYIIKKLHTSKVLFISLLSYNAFFHIHYKVLFLSCQDIMNLVKLLQL